MREWETEKNNYNEMQNDNKDMENKLQRETKLLKIVIKQLQSVTKNPEGVNNKNMETQKV